MLNDTTRVKSAYDLERKYGLWSLKTLQKNVEDAQTTLTKVNNSLNNMIQSFLINLGDLLDTQSDISLWFYSGTPTLENKPYTNWTTPDEHKGDFYYDTSTGYVYKYTGEWELQTDSNLISAMALTNASIGKDKERKVFLTTPSPPYSSGDWWIQDDGILMICQISRESGDYKDNDFINSSEYSNAIASAIVTELGGTKTTILNGTVIEKTDKWVKFTDLSTGGSTVIAGDNITTGEIKSQNYVKDTSGMCINLTNGLISTPNCDINENLVLKNGGDVITDRGLYTNLQFKSDIGMLGLYSGWWNGATEIRKGILSLNCYIPPNFTVKSAILTLHTFKTYNSINKEYTDGIVSNYGKLNNIRLYKLSDPVYNYSSSYGSGSITNLGDEVENAFSGGSYSENSTNKNSVLTNELKDYLETGETTYTYDNLLGTDLSNSTLKSKLSNFIGIMSYSGWEDFGITTLIKGNGGSICGYTTGASIEIRYCDDENVTTANFFNGTLLYSSNFGGRSGGKFKFSTNIVDEFTIPSTFGPVVEVNNPIIEGYKDNSSSTYSIFDYLEFSKTLIENCSTTFQLATGDSIPIIDSNDSWATTVSNQGKYAYAVLDVFGYTKIGG